MKILKRLILGLFALIVVLFVVLAIFISTLDLNSYKEEIQKATRDQTGRDLAINGELDASFFPWFGISIGQIELSNASGFGDKPFAKMDAANVKVEVFPLLRSQINVQSVELDGLSLDLQRAADGSTNWDDLMQASASTSTTTDNQTTEVEGGAPAIAALAVGGISVSNANVSWTDAQGGSDASLTGFNLQTGAIELAKPFSLKTGFDLVSKSFATTARMDAEGEVTIDLEQQKYSLTGLELSTSASGEGVPVENAALKLGGDITADLGNQTIDIAKLLLDAMGIELSGQVNVTNLDTDPGITAGLQSAAPFSLLELFQKLGIEAPVTADKDVMKSVSLKMDLAANSQSADLNNLTITLDDTTFTGKMSLPNLSGDLPPVRFDFNVDDIDVDRYLPPPLEMPEGEQAPVEGEPAVATTGDEPIELPLEMMRKLDIDGKFSVGKVKVSNLTTGAIVMPLKAKDGVISLDGIKAQMYEGQLASRVVLNAKKAKPSFSVKAGLVGILAEPLLADLLQDDAPLSGKGDFNLDITTGGDTVNSIKSALNGGYNLKFADGAINGVNIGYQMRRARAKIDGKTLSAEEEIAKTDFSALTMSGIFTNGVLSSDDLDLRAPVLRVNGKGTVDLNKEFVDYKLKTLLSDTSKGQGGKGKDELSGLKLSIPIRGHFDELSTDFTAAILQGLKDDAKAKLDAATNKAKDKAKAQLKEKEAEAKAKLKAEEAKLKADLKEKEKAKIKELKEKNKEKADKLKEKAKEKLKGLFN